VVEFILPLKGGAMAAGMIVVGKTEG
jgi:hypothetical protein